MLTCGEISYLCVNSLFMLYVLFMHMQPVFTLIYNVFYNCIHLINIILGFSCSSVSKESACSTGNLGSIPGSGRSPGEGNGNTLQYSCPENPGSLHSLQGLKELDMT